ncbi:hypothetical protein V1525DRAFT_271391 [Lipomyces kononenkoae]|uniref:Uncharacterized protein n=1 Tax=Lipomyces kononenkoae TaxID=34357 RepID=A0ACC3SUS6_LIPKO
MEPVLRALASDSLYLHSLNQDFNQAQQDHKEAKATNAIPLDALREARGGTSAGTHPTKPREFIFDGQSKNLSRFLNRLERDFRLYKDEFPTVKVAYASTGQPRSGWAQQFYRKGPQRVLMDWAAFTRSYHYEGHRSINTGNEQPWARQCSGRDS